MKKNSKYAANDALEFIHGTKMKELKLHRFDKPERTKYRLFAIGGATGRQFAIVLGDTNVKTNYHPAKQTRIIFEKCTLPAWSELEEIFDSYKSSRVKKSDSKLYLDSQTSCLVADEATLSALIFWYANINELIPVIHSESLAKANEIQEKLHSEDFSNENGIVVIDNDDYNISIEEQEKLDADISKFSPSEKDAIVKIRIGQGKFRKELISLSRPHCWMSGVEGLDLLIASHIKPWSHCNQNSIAKRDVNNGLLLSALWDAAFDGGLISFDNEWKVIVSEKLSESASLALNVLHNSELPLIYRNKFRLAYLEYHRLVIFK
jgi:hypothetical protein